MSNNFRAYTPLLRAGGLASAGQQNQDRSLRGNALAAACEAEALGRRGFHRDVIDRNPEQRRQSGPHRRRMRGDFRAFANQGDIGIGEASAAGGDAPGRVPQKSGAVGILPGFFAGRKMPPDIAFGQGAVDGVA